MNNRKYNTDPAELLRKGQEIVGATDASTFQHRVEMVNLVLGGMTPSQLSEYVAESKNTITRWVKTADEQGFEKLADASNKGGRPTKITDSIAEKIDAALQADPKDYGYDVWDGPTIAKFIKDTFDIDYSVRQCQRMMHDLGYSIRRLQTFPCKDENDPRRGEFKKR